MIRFIGCACFLFCFFIAESRAQEALSLWQDQDKKQQIMQFVNETTNNASPNYLPPEKRIVVFSADSLLWADDPMYIELLFATSQLKQLPKTAFKDFSEGQKDSLQRNPIQGLIQLTPEDRHHLLKAIRKNLPEDEYQQKLTAWLAKNPSPNFTCDYTQLAYAPMVELLNYLQQMGFKIFLLSHASQDFISVLSLNTYYLAPYQIITDDSQMLTTPPSPPADSQMLLTDLIAQSGINSLWIEKNLQSRPIISVGNQDIDLPLLRYTGQNTPHLCIVIKNAHLKQQLLREEAQTHEWLMIGPRGDFTTLFRNQNCKLNK